MKKQLLLALSIAISTALPAWAAKEGEQAPLGSIRDFNSDKQTHLIDLKGKVVYLDFWASWCLPCKLSFPSLNKLYNELNNKGFEVVAVNLDEEKQDAVKFLAENPINFSIGYDAEGLCPSAFGVIAMPSSFIIDKQGKIRKIHLGFKPGDITHIREKVLALLNE
jgi:thiol-disulfide isomerase/thioredoxin